MHDDCTDYHDSAELLAAVRAMLVAIQPAVRPYPFSKTHERERVQRLAVLLDRFHLTGDECNRSVTDLADHRMNASTWKISYVAGPQLA